MMKPLAVAIAVTALLPLAAPGHAQDKRPPYWASIASGQAMMRTGPGKTYPGIWLYQRRDLPVRVVQTFPEWRKIEDADGTQGWMLVTLLSDRRTAMIRDGAPRAIRSEGRADAPVRYRAEPGVVARIEKCEAGWCRLRIGNREGWAAQGDLWGVDEGETL